MDLNLNQVQQKALPDFKFKTGSIGEVVTTLLPYLFSIAGILVLLYLIFGGIQLMTSIGDPKAVQSAKGKITGALIGFVIIFAAYWIVQIVASILGIQGTGFGSIINLQ